jgi:DNA invertase Pin-like site-specific DNA recombinase
MKVAAYVRVSSRSQNQETQIDSIQRAAHARMDGITQWFIEKESAKKMDRAELVRLRAAVRAGEVSAVYVFRLDRLSRTGIRDTLSLIEEFRRNGCRVVSIHDGFDLEGPFAEVVIAVIAWAAQMERLALGERIAAARARIEAEGGRWGRPRRLVKSEVVEIRERHAGGETVRHISVALKIPRSTVASALSEKGPYALVCREPSDQVLGPQVAE